MRFNNAHDHHKVREPLPGPVYPASTRATRACVMSPAGSLSRELNPLLYTSASHGIDPLAPDPQRIARSFNPGPTVLYRFSPLDYTTCAIEAPLRQ
jgi:hypothetical protein